MCNRFSSSNKLLKLLDHCMAADTHFHSFHILITETYCKAINDILISTSKLSPGGILDEETVARGLSNLGLSADGMYQVYLDVTIPGFSLVDITALGEFVQLQKVEVSHNNISDLSPLSKLPYLLYLNASHNNISQLLNFAPPFNLLEVDLSYNQINTMSDLSAHHALRKLVLDNNLITEIKGLENCQCLKNLSLAHNHLEAIQGLDNLPLQYLNLCHNMIKRIENIGSLNNLRNLNLSGNKVRSLQGLEGHDVLESIDLEDNEVIDIVEVRHIQHLRMLCELNLLRNPIQELPDYRLAILFHIPRLCLLDRHKVEVEEKVSAKNTFDASLEVIAARDHIMHVVYSFLQPQRIWDSTLPSVETPYPMLVLVGPQGSGKKELSMKLVEEFADYFGYGVSHTTRLPRPHEEDGKDYYFVSLERFEIDIRMGQFIQTHRIDDAWYGLQMESIECVAREGLACVIHMELEGVLTLKNTYFEPRYVLIIPLEKEAYERRLQQCGLYTEAQIEHILKRADLYCKYNQDHPGFFDMMISSEDIAEAYHKLRRLVMDYLGISSLSPVTQANNMNEAGKSETQQPATGETSANQPTGQARPKLSGTEYTSPTRCHVSSAAGKGIVEEESIRRRQSAAKEVVTGYVPPIYEQLLAQYPGMTPRTARGQQGLDDKSDTLINNNANSSHAHVPIIPGQPALTSSSTSSSSSLSDLDSATEFHQPLSPRMNSRPQAPDSNPITTDLVLSKRVSPLDLVLDSKLGSLTQRKIHDPRPPSTPRMIGSGQGSRPGSNRHKILPPIAAQ